MLAHSSRIIHNIEKESGRTSEDKDIPFQVIQTAGQKHFLPTLASRSQHMVQKAALVSSVRLYTVYKKAGSQGNRLMSITNNAPYRDSLAESIHRSHHVVFVVVSPITSLRWYDPDQVQRVRNLMRFRLSPDNSDSPSNVNKLQHIHCRFIFSYAGL